ncbi:MAG TPA: PilZ domain-containing protein [Terriglobales bacterium]|jgi:hypothetical protein|nr:PilZ domain-containing protein [Terriglobales bacterium]
MIPPLSKRGGNMSSKLSAPGPEDNEAKYSDVRRWPRYHVDLRIRATVTTDDKEVSVFGRGGDLGQGGMAAFLPIDLPVGIMLDLELTLPYTSQPLKLRAEVRNSSGFKYGLEFVDITTSEQDLIVRTCSTLALVQ